jgi:hypothetical protein
MNIVSNDHLRLSRNHSTKRIRMREQLNGNFFLPKENVTKFQIYVRALKSRRINESDLGNEYKLPIKIAERRNP